MKNLSLILIVSFLSLQSCKSQDNLYLLFENNSKHMNKSLLYKNSPYNYRFTFESNEINLTSDIDPQIGKAEIDTVSFREIRKLKLRNYKWFANFIRGYKHPDYINFPKIFKNMYVIEIDSAKQKAIITKVQYVIYEY